MPGKSVLVVEDEESIRDSLVELFEAGATHIRAAATLGDAHRLLAERPVDLVITDLRLGAKRDGGLQVMAAAGLLAPDATVVVLTAYPDDANRHAAKRLGATHFLQKPIDLDVLARMAATLGIATALSEPVSSTG